MRQLLLEGNVQEVALLLGRPYRLIAALPAAPLVSAHEQAQLPGDAGSSSNHKNHGREMAADAERSSEGVFLSAGTLLNQAPGPGCYKAAVAVVAMSGQPSQISRESATQEPLMLPSLLPWEASGALMQGSSTCSDNLVLRVQRQGTDSWRSPQSAGVAAQQCCFVALAQVDIGRQGVTIKSKELSAVLEQTGAASRKIVIDFETCA